MPTDLDDPSLGLQRDGLLNLRRATRSRASDTEVIEQLPDAVHAVISIIVGEMSTERKSLSALKTALMGVCLTERFDDETGNPLETPLGELIEIWDAWRLDLRCGWGDGRTGLRLAFKHQTVLDGGSRRRRDEPLYLRHQDDSESLDAAWNRVKHGSGRLAVAACAAFFPPQRRVAVTGVAEPVDMPSAWELVAQLILWGPDETQLRLLQYLADEAHRQVRPRGNRCEGGQLSHGSLANVASNVYTVINAIHRVAQNFSALQGWRKKPERIQISDIDAQVQEWLADRTAVPLATARRARKRLKDDVEKRRGRDGRPRNALRSLRDLIMFDLVSLGVRIGELARITPADVLEHVSIGDYVGAAIRFHPSKPRRGAKRLRQPRLRPITEETLLYLKEWFALAGLDPSDAAQSIWSSSRSDNGQRRRLRAASLSNRFGASKTGTAVKIIPKPDTGGYSAHALRHMAEQLAWAVGAHWLASEPAWQERVSAQVFADALLDHAMASDRLGYKDLEANRDVWAMRALIGAPEHNVHGVLALLQGVEGARLGWDLATIKDAHEGREAADKVREDLSLAQAELKVELRTVRHRTLPPIPRDAPGDQDRIDALLRKVEVLLERDEAREARQREERRVYDQLEEARDRLAHAEERRQGALRVLLTLRAGGRSLPIDDAQPTTAELRRGSASVAGACGLEDETWEEALERAGIDPSVLDANDSEPQGPRRVRHLLNMPEFALLLSLTEGAVRKRIRRIFPEDKAQSPVIVKGPKLRFIDVDQLPRTFLGDLLPEQLDLLEEMLSIPMGRVCGGRTI